MNIVVLMAGEGRRFVDQGFKTLKTLIKVDGKPIFEWTLNSLPLKSVKHKLWFVVKSEHCDKFPLVEDISEIFPDANFIFLSDKQKGNLFSAFQATAELPVGWQSEELLFLDADNHYDGSLFFEFLKFLDVITDDLGFLKGYGAVVTFKPLDDSPKWGFAIPSPRTKMLIEGFLEKDERALKMGGMPMMGCFYFSSGNLFGKVATQVLGRSQTGEYYLTQAMQEVLDLRDGGQQWVFNFITPYVAPMGTPEDLQVFEGPYWMN